jgi:hypothetical protein
VPPEIAALEDALRIVRRLVRRALWSRGEASTRGWSKLCTAETYLERCVWKFYDEPKDAK